MTLTALLKLYLQGTVPAETPGQDPRARVRRGQPAPGSSRAPGQRQSDWGRGLDVRTWAWTGCGLSGTRREERTPRCLAYRAGTCGCHTPACSSLGGAPPADLKLPEPCASFWVSSPRPEAPSLSAAPAPLPMTPTGIFMCSLRTSPVLLGDESLPPFVIWENLTYVSILMLTTTHYLIFQLKVCFPIEL